MKFLILCLCALSAAAGPVPRGARPAQAAAVAEVRAAAAPAPAPGSDAAASVLRSEFDSSPEGNFQTNFETDNGISQQSVGEVKVVDKATVVVMRGQYSYVNPDGKTVVVSYVADENGFQPESEYLPVAPAVPEQIQRSLEYIAAHPEKAEFEATPVVNRRA